MLFCIVLCETQALFKVRFEGIPQQIKLRYCNWQKSVILWRGYSFFMLATELFTKKWKGKEYLNR